MTAQLSAYGRLGQAPRAIETRSGRPMTVASLAVDVGEAPDAPPLWLGLVAFGPMAETLLRHDKGDLVSAAGRLQRRTWTDSDGATREQGVATGELTPAEGASLVGLIEAFRKTAEFEDLEKRVARLEANK